jgi:hypothetical protein
MSRSETRPPKRSAAQSGQSLIVVLALTGILALLVVTSLTFARSSSSQSGRASRGAIAVQAADSGVNQYLSRIVEDPQYWNHYVDVAEDPRTDSHGVVHAPGSDWVPGEPWTYAGSSSTWTDLQDSRFGVASYSLRISPPVAGSPIGSDTIVVQSTARVQPAGTTTTQLRSVQAQIKPQSIADFQMISAKSILYGSGATTTGKLYSAQDITHLGTAKAPVYAQHFACRTGGLGCGHSDATSPSFEGGGYDSATTPAFSDIFTTPIDFSNFTDSLATIESAAAATVNHRFDDGTAKAWLIQFLSNGTAKIWKVTTTTDGANLGALGCPITVPLSSGNAPSYFYFEQSVVVGNGNAITDSCAASSGARPSVVDGRVTVATGANVYIGGNISYETPGDDVLGLLSAHEVIIAEYVPTDLTWRAATLAQNGQWRTNTGTEKKNSMVFIGSTATSNGGYASMFHTRSYNYDPTLQFLRPPLFPILEGTWETAYWREVTPP